MPRLRARPCGRCTTTSTGRRQLWARATHGQRCSDCSWISAWTRNSRFRSAGARTFSCSTTTPYIPLLGAEKHPWALGRPASEVGPHLWPASEEHLREVMETGRPYHNEDQQLIIDRHGFPEEAYFTFSLSAIRDADGTIVGVFNAITETTQHILYERRLQVLRRLGTVSITADDSLASTCRAAVDVIGRNRKSVPFAAVFLREVPAEGVRRIAGYGFDETAAGCELVDLAPTSGPVLEVLHHGGTALVSGLRERYPGVFAPGPLGPLTPDQAFVLPVIMLGTRTTDRGAGPRHQSLLATR